MRNKLKFEDKKYLSKIVANWTKCKVEFELGDSLVFLDETGSTTLNHVHSMFGIGGCIVSAMDYGAIKVAWRGLKKSVFGLGPTDVFHASRHLRDRSPNQLAPISKFLTELPMRFIGTDVQRGTYIGDHREIEVVAEGVGGLVGEYLPSNVTTVRWYFEHSDSTANVLLRSMFEKGNTFFYINRAAQNYELQLVPKKVCEPGLEIADLLTNCVALKVKKPLLYNKGLADIVCAAFGDLSKGSWRTIIFASETVATGNIKQAAVEVSYNKREPFVTIREIS